MNRENRISVVGGRGLIGCWLITASSESTTGSRKAAWIRPDAFPAGDQGTRYPSLDRDTKYRRWSPLWRLEEAALMGRLGVHL
jgi:hypothetical protein